MKRYLLFLLVFILITRVNYAQRVITEDVYRFWKAYDVISKTPDTLKQLAIIDSMYILKGTPGLKAIMEVRGYTADSYVYAINHYPKFWKSVRKNTTKGIIYGGKIEKAIFKLKKMYPALKPAEVYFTIGALRTNGTTLSNMVLIGSELAMADTKTNTSEIKNEYSHLPAYFAGNPLKSIVFLNVHEYVHTQQKTTIGNTLLAQTVIEGVAEFVASRVLNVESPNPQIKYGKENMDKIKADYIPEMFSPFVYNWIWNDADNSFKMRDLGYYVGYAICENYYNVSEDKNKAIAEMIELDYNDEEQLIRFVEKSKYFAVDFHQVKETFEGSRPVVTSIREFKNGDLNVDNSITTVTLEFSQPMNVNARGFDYGPLGEDNVLRIEQVIGFSEDKLSFSYTVKMEPGKRYQVLVTSWFMSETGIPLKPYLIDVTTKEN